MKQTPIQGLTVLVEEALYAAKSKEVRRVFRLLLKRLYIQAEAEQTFARECFEAGASYGRDSCLSTDDGMPTQQPNFDEWFSQYSKQEE